MNTKEKLNTAETVRMRKAKVIAGNGWVRRSDGHFVVRESAKMARYFIVERGGNGDLRCSCPVFKSESKGRTDFRCVHLMAVRYAISLKKTESIIPAVSPIKIKTEPRKSERGEQRSRNTLREVSELRHLGGIDLTAFRLEKIRGNKEMVQNASNTNTKPAENNERAIQQDNILDFSATLNELRNSVDPQLIRQREGWDDRNGTTHMVDYVEWHTVADILDSAAPNWTHTVKDIRTIGEYVAVTVAITIEGITREGIGTGQARSETGIKKAEHDALKRAAVKFGIARGLYKRGFESIDSETETEKTQAFPENPIAMNLSDILSGKQLRMIRAVARERDLDVDGECSRLMNCAVNELSKRAASAFIDHIQKMAPTPSEVPLRRAG